MGRADFLYSGFISKLAYQPTSCQDSLLRKVADFVCSDDEDILVVNGYAGTGKTTAVSAVISLLKEYQTKCVLLAPTGRAAKVLSSYAGQQAYTIHKHIYRQKSVGGDGFGQFSLAPNKDKETLFVVDSMTGQDAVNTAKAFNEVIDFDGVILTKLDGDTRGGAALTIKHVVNKPIKFVGLGEKMGDIDMFYPDRMANRILGMGDIVSFVEKAQEQYDEEQARKINKRIKTNEFDFNDFLSQIAQIKKMGNLKDLVGMIPGMGKMMKDVEIDNDAFKGIEAMIGSMTPYERRNPSKIDTSRRRRIAKGSGTSIEEVNRLMKQFDETKKMMKMMSSGKMNAMKNIRRR